MPDPAPIRVRLAQPGDAEAIRAIYNVEVEGSTVTFDLVPRTAAEQEAWMAEHAGAHPVVVALDAADAVVGFGSLSPYKVRPAYAPTVEDSVYVRDDQRGNGVGRALLEELIALARRYGYHSVIARIVGGHDASIRLHRQCGFAIVGTEREVGRKLGRWLDVVVMQRLL
jgi:phosphinothricin acetyltransferase